MARPQVGFQARHGDLCNNPPAVGIRCLIWLTRSVPTRLETASLFSEAPGDGDGGRLQSI